MTRGGVGERDTQKEKERDTQRGKECERFKIVECVKGAIESV